MSETKSLLREIFADAAEITDPAARAAFLDLACGSDRVLRKKLERLLTADSRAGNFLGKSGDTTTGLFSEKIGDRIGRYRLVERIGRGGGGVVYLAEQEEPVRRRVALKIIKLGMDTQSVVARFEAERQALAMMDHPNIAKVLDAGATETGRPFFVMELVSGMKLSEYCERHQLSLPRRLELFVSVCHAVQHAHQKGIVHRDLKPSNILVMEHEGVAVPKVIDFGIAKATEQGLDEQGGLTSVNQFLGTPAYMSPEQVECGGRDIDTRSDIYSLGVILYELLAGQPPFDPRELAQAGVEEIRRIIREVDPPRPSTTITKGLNPARLPSPSHRGPSRERLAAIRGDLDWVVMKCLEKDRTRRYETANGLAMDVRRHLENQPVIARPPSAGYRMRKIVRRHRIAFATAGTILLVLVAAAIVSSHLAFRATRAEREQSRLRGVAESNADESRQRLVRRYVAEANRLTEQRRPTMALPWMVAALQLETGDPQREADERLRIAQALVDTPELKLHVAQGRSVHCVALSPDGRLLASGSDNGLVRISDVLSGGAIHTNVAMAASVATVQFSPDGKRLAAVDATGQARVWDAASGAAITPLMRADDFNKGLMAEVRGKLKPSASFSPDGKSLLLACGSKSAHLRDASTGEALREFRHRDAVYHAAFSPDGQHVVTSSKDNSACVWETATGKLAAPALEHGSVVTWAQFSSDGNTLLTVREWHFVQLWDWREARRLGREIPRRSVLSHASLSPNGSNVLTVAWSGYAHVYDAASTRITREFLHQGGVMDAAFSPDGGYIATAAHDGNVWIRESGDAVGEPRVLPAGNQIEQIAFSGDSRMLAVATRGGHARVWDLAPTPHGVRRFPGYEVQGVQFDPSGRRALILSTKNESGLTVYDSQSGQPVSTAKFKSGQVTHAKFSADGRRILAFGSTSTALVFDTESGRKTIPALAHERRVQDAVWSPDGKFVFTSAGVAGALAWDSETGNSPSGSSIRAPCAKSRSARTANCSARATEIKRCAFGKR